MTVLALETAGLVKSYQAGAPVLDGLDLAVPAGRVFGLMGLNGAGKTTAIKLLLGLLRPDAGTACILGLDMWRATPIERTRVAAVPQEIQVYDWLTVTELCRHVACFYPRWDPDYARRLIRRFDLAQDLDRPSGQLSGGQRRKLAMLLALAARPDVLLLDEPAANLDPVARRELLAELIDILNADGGPTVLYSTHVMADLERLADDVGVLHRGRLLYQGPLDDLRDSVRRVQVVFDGPPPPGFEVPGALWSQASGSVLHALVQVPTEADLAPIRQLPGAQVQVFALSLEDIFVNLVGAEGGRETVTVELEQDALGGLAAPEPEPEHDSVGGDAAREPEFGPDTTAGHDNDNGSGPRTPATRSENRP